MPLNKSAGNMYDWVTSTHSHLAGECSHKCKYCYVQKNRFGVSPRYKGEPRLKEDELNVNYGSGKSIFIEHMNDLFAESIKYSWIQKILSHCKEYPNNTYVFQTKNPNKAFNLWEIGSYFPKDFIMGTTIESDIYYPEISSAPAPGERYLGIRKFKSIGVKTFVTIEPIMEFNIDVLSVWIVDAHPDFVNIGADSKGCHLPEPSKEKILELIKILTENKIVIKQKSNLQRILK